MFLSARHDLSASTETKPPKAADPAYVGPDRRRNVVAVFDPVYVGRFVWRWRWLVLLATLAGLLAGIAFALSTPKTYASGTQILLDPRDIKVVQNEVAPNALPSDATLALVESQMALILSNRVVSEVIAKADLEADPEFNGDRPGILAGLLPFLASAETQTQEERRAMLEARLRRALTVGRDAKSFIINLDMTTESAEKSARLANLFADAFIAEIGRIQSDTARRATVALSSRLSELRRSVGQAERQVEDYKTRNSLIGVNGRLVDDEYITRLNDALARARADLTAVRVRAGSLRSASVDDVVSGVLPEELSSEALMRLRQSYSELAQTAGSLATKLGPRHPQRIAIEGSLRAARQSIKLELARIVGAGQTELERAEATERDLTAQVDELKGKQAETSGAFVKLRELEREVDASRAVYEAFLLRARETSEQESFNTANIRVVSEATPPLHAVGPSRKLLALAGAIGGFALGTGLLAGLAMLRLVIGFLRLDRRRAAARSIGRANRPDPGQAEEGRPERIADAAPETAGAASQRSAPSMPDTKAPRRALAAGDPDLRERIRDIAAAARHMPAPRRKAAEEIQRELQSVRRLLAEMRLERSGGA